MGAENDQRQDGRPLAPDPQAESARSDLPAFLAPPPGAPAYHGFPVLEDVEFDGFRLGMITDFDASPDSGDAFIVAPDGSRGGLMWEVDGDPDSIRQLCPIGASRWGVWFVHVPAPLNSVEGRRRALETLVPRLRDKWELWRQGSFDVRSPEDAQRWYEERGL